MTDITNTFGTLYHPQKAFVVYEQQGTAKHIYVECYDLDPTGRPINAHPLSLLEAGKLCKALHTTEKKQSSFLASKGLLPSNVLHIRTDRNPYALWHTPAQAVKLYFREDLGIQSGFCNIPAMVWKATKTSIAVYALADGEIRADAMLFNAPFFNMHDDGRVCMGNVSLDIKKDCSLEDFISLWERAFFDSYFSHLIMGYSPVKGNIVQLWKSLSGTGKPFPTAKLILSKKTLINLIQ
jgi:PRTRC genetic system protein B